MKKMILIIALIMFLLIVGTIIFISMKEDGFLKGGGSKNVMTIHTGKPHEIIFEIYMGEIPNGTNVSINNKSAKKGDNVNLGDEIEIKWGDKDDAD